MATTIHDVIEQDIAAGATYTYAYDVTGATRSFFQVVLSALGGIEVTLYIQSPSNAGDRNAGLTSKGGGIGRRVELATDPSTPIQVPSGQSLVVKVKNLAPVENRVKGWINGSTP